MVKIKKISLIILIIFYLVAGLNHFYNPQSYYRLIPPYIPWPQTVNLFAGFFEFSFAIMLIFKTTRKLAAWGIILMLLAFLPVHVSMISNAPLRLGNLTVIPFIAWIRLVVLQPLLILWAWWYTNDKLKVD